MTVDPQKAKGIFLDAVERHAPAERADFLRQACGDDAELRQWVEELLAAHGGDDSLLDHASMGRHNTERQTEGISISERPGTQIGPYKLLEQIGEGGMGVVYHASQREPVRRTVALKIIKPGMDTREVVARFEAERQALAMMDHPNIAKVFDGGVTDAGRPYFAMELVRGQPITAYCDREQLSTRQRLALFVAVCQGVQHAHQKGIIHRDLKPSNILIKVVDVRPVPVVIDFGIAKAMGQQLSEQSLHTAFDQMVGTPLYMSPEQASQNCLDVDTRSDIYALGVVLYELLTGHTPFEKDTLRTVGVDELRRIIREVDPPRPSARVSTLVAADLSTVCERRKVEPRRLRQQLRGDLDWIVMQALDKHRDRRYASVSALAADVQRYLDDEPVQARPPSWAHHAAKWVRRHRPLVRSTVAVLAVAVLAGGVFFGSSYRRAAQLERDAGEHLAAATALLETGNYAAADRELADARGHLEATGDRAGPLQEKLAELALPIAAVQRCEEFQTRSERIHSEMYALDRVILDQAQEHCRAALDLIGVFANEPWKSQAYFTHLDPARQARLDEGAVELLFIWARLEMGRSDTQPTAERTAGYRRAIEALGKIEKSHPSIPAVALWMADGWEAIGDPSAAAGARARAESLQTTSATDHYLLGAYHAQHGRQDEALASYWQALMQQPDHYLALLAAGVALGELRRFESAETMLTGAIALNPQTVIAYVQRAAARREQSKIVLAQADIEEAKKRDPELARALLQRADEYQANFQLVQALADYNETIRLDPQAAAYEGRGVVYFLIGDLDKALADCNESVRRAPDSAQAYRRRANVYRFQEDWDRALADANEAIRLDAQDARNIWCRGGIYLDQRALDKGLADFEQAIHLDPKESGYRVSRGVLYVELGEWEKALADYQEALRLNPKDIWAYFSLASLYHISGDLDKALSTAQEAVRIAPQFAQAYTIRADIQRFRGDFAQALADYDEAVRIAPQYAKARTSRAAFYRDRGDFEKALVDYSEAIRLSPNEPGVWLQRGVFHKDRGDFQQALADYGEAIRVAPRYTRAYTTRAALYTDRGDFAKALADYDEAIRVAPQNAGAYTARAGFYRDRGELEKALADANEAIRLNPNIASTYVSRADTYRAMRQLDKGLADMNEAIRLVPQHAGGYGHRGHFYRERGDFELALTDYSEAIRLCPRFVDAYVARAALYTDRGDFAKALADYNEAIRVAPEKGSCYADRGNFYVHRGELDKALADYDEAIRLAPENGWCYAERGNFYSIYQDRPEFAKAVADYDRAVELGLISWHFYKRAGLAHFRLQHYDKALEYIAKAVELHPGDGGSLSWIPPAEVARCPDEHLRQGLLELADKGIETTGVAEAYAARGILRHAFGYQEEALADFRKAVEFEPTNPVLWYQRGLTQLAAGRLDEYRQGGGDMLQRFAPTDKANDGHWVAWTCALAPDAITDWTTAIALAEKAVQSDPKFVMYLNTLGAVLYRSGRFDEALARLTEIEPLVQEPSEAIKSPPAYIWFFLAMTQHRLGHIDEAKQWLDKAIAWTDKTIAEADQGTADLTWNRRLTLKLLREEATALLRVTPPAVESVPEPAAKEEAQPK